MNKYLLLRDNKQTGPYTVEELVKKGLKPYDLVWLDGRSAAWRYPSEIDELKAFAPVVEEQPYDRFYKRSSTAQEHAIHAAQQQLGKHEQSQPAVEQTISKNITAQTKAVVQGMTEQAQSTVMDTPKETVTRETVAQPVVKTGTGKVYVTLPAGFRQPQAVQPAQPVVTEKAAQEEKQINSAATQSDKDQEAAGVPEEAAKALEDRAAALARSVQAAAAESAAKKQSAQQAIQQWHQQTHTATAPSTEQSVPFSSLINTNHQEETVPVIPIRNRSGRKQVLLMRSIVAACLLLGGIVIGMALTYSSNSSKNQQALDQLVQRLQEREARSQASIPVEQTADINQVPGHPSATDASTTAPSNEQSSPPSPSGDELALKDKQVPPARTENDDAPITYQEKEPVMKVTPAVITQKEEPRPLSEAEMAAAREKIFQMVQVAASPFRTGVLGGISNLYFTISNTSPFTLDKIELEVKYLGPEKRVVKVQRLIFNDIGAGGQKTLEAPRTSRGVSIDYVVTKINSKALGIARSGF